MQLRTSAVIKKFHETFKKKFNFEEYTSLDKPAVFFGLYQCRDIHAVELHKGIKIIWLAGFDATRENTLSIIKNRACFQDAIVIAESPWIKKDLDKFGIKYESISLCMDDIYKWKVYPLGKSLYWYKANQSRYGKQYLPIIKKEFPDLDIITNDVDTTPRDELYKVYANCFACLRPIEHDGMSQGVAEMGLMGRISIWNGDVPFCKKYNSIEDIINIIRDLRTNWYNPKLIAYRARNYFIENETKWTDLILKLCGTSELDAANIFYECDKRPGSIFRIMRKEVVDKMPEKFGSQQFERPRMVEQIRELGLKGILCNKNSGFVTREFKNNSDGRKGYPDGIPNIHTIK
jgi:hypothetical protein